MYTNITIVFAPAHVAPARIGLVKGGEVEAYVEDTKPWHTKHEHLFDEITRNGTGHCVSCGVTAWSMWWVADGIYGDGTKAWAEAIEKGYREQYETQVSKRLQRVLGAVLMSEEPSEIKTVVLAVMDGNAPAKRRTGIPVPPMEHMRLA